MQLTSQQIADAGKTIAEDDYRDTEFCGACWDPLARTLFVNIQTPGITRSPGRGNADRCKHGAESGDGMACSLLAGCGWTAAAQWPCCACRGPTCSVPEIDGSVRWARALRMRVIAAPPADEIEM
ncbi:alkaline phosphatase PhoX [Xanthomonas oryzae]|uniref:alkaline phosphatase PhoX n=1 Tax=Xanthomonas oryzae TaxID=347 RepID=UPI003CE5C764